MTVCDANQLVKPSTAGAIFHSGGANCTSGRNLSLTLTFLLLRLCVKRKQPFCFFFFQRKFCFSHESTHLEHQSFCCEEYSEIARRKIAQKKFHASACVIFNVTVDSAGGQALRSRDSSVLKTSKALDRAIFSRTSQVLTTDSRIIIVIIIIITITIWHKNYILRRNEKRRRQYFRSEYSGLCEVSNLYVFHFRFLT